MGATRAAPWTQTAIRVSMIARYAPAAPCYRAAVTSSCHEYRTNIRSSTAIDSLVVKRAGLLSPSFGLPGGGSSDAGGYSRGRRSERHLTTREPTSSHDSLATSQLDPHRSGNCGLLVRLWGGVAGVTRCVAKGCHAVCTPLAYDPRSVVPS